MVTNIVYIIRSGWICD